MKKTLIIGLAIVMVLSIAGTALASGYTAPVAGTSPHGGYTTATARCKVCHATHQATGTYKLTRNNTAAAQCDYCHGTTGVANANGLQGLAATNGHFKNSPTTTVPDATDTTLASNMVCASCHSVHGQAVWNAKILKADPQGTSASVAYVAGDDRLWCATCHDLNSDTAVNGDSHAMKVWTDNYATPEGNMSVAFSNATSCDDCHTSTGTSNYPHFSAGIVLLKTGATTANLDGVCLDCHSNSADGLGVGVSY